MSTPGAAGTGSTALAAHSPRRTSRSTRAMRTSDRGRRSPPTATAPGRTAARTRSPTTEPPPNGRPRHPASTSRSARSPTTGTPIKAEFSRCGSSSSNSRRRRTKALVDARSAAKTHDEPRTRRGACTALSTRGACWAPPRACGLIEQADLREDTWGWGWGISDTASDAGVIR
eukprot:scaffold110487_cov44-Phaeocystis_antarctica.AAC.1